MYDHLLACTDKIYAKYLLREITCCLLPNKHFSTLLNFLSLSEMPFKRSLKLYMITLDFTLSCQFMFATKFQGHSDIKKIIIEVLCIEWYAVFSMMQQFVFNCVNPNKNQIFFLLFF